MAFKRKNPGRIPVPSGVSDMYNTWFKVTKKDDNGELGINLIKSPVYGFRQLEDDISDNVVKYYGIHYDPDLTNTDYHKGGFSKGQVFNPLSVKTNYDVFGIGSNERSRASIIKPVGLSDYYNSVLTNIYGLSAVIPNDEIVNQANWASQTKAISYNWHYDINMSILGQNTTGVRPGGNFTNTATNATNIPNASGNNTLNTSGNGSNASNTTRTRRDRTQPTRAKYGGSSMKELTPPKNWLQSVGS